MDNASIVRSRFMSVLLLAACGVMLSASWSLGASPATTSPASAPARELTFVVNCVVRSGKEFETYAVQAAKLKEFGRVEMAVGFLSGKDVSCIPAGGSAWHEYGAYLPTLARLFPHPDLAPFTDAKFVGRNQQLLKECVAVLRKYDMGAALRLYEPFYVDGAFFGKYEQLRGPRVDQTRRSRQAEFAMCIDQPRTREMYASMMEQLVKAVPELGTVTIRTNDDGAGLCWSDYLYPTANGPSACEGRSTGQRISALIACLRRGAGADKNIDFSVNGMFSKSEDAELRYCTDDHFFFGNGPTVRVEATSDQPALGIVNPLDIARSLERLKSSGRRKVMLNFEQVYERGSDSPETVAKVVEIITEYLRNPPAAGSIGRLQFVRQMCVKWVGQRDADSLLEAFVSMNDAMNARRAALPGFDAADCGVSMRMITRPLVAAPQLLTPKEEAYFLPFVFNASQEEARNDYIDNHGSRMTAPLREDSSWPMIRPADDYVWRINGVADRLAKLHDGDGVEFLHRMGTSLRIHASVIRSIRNFYIMQTLRDRNKDKFAATTQPATSKVATSSGDADYKAVYECMRDELDNTNELLALLRNGGLANLATAATPEQEDTFLLGPNVLEQLDKKRQIMEKHWLDAQRFLMSPNR